MMQWRHTRFTPYTVSLSFIYRKHQWLPLVADISIGSRLRICISYLLASRCESAFSLCRPSLCSVYLAGKLTLMMSWCEILLSFAVLINGQATKSWQRRTLGGDMPTWAGIKVSTTHWYLTWSLDSDVKRRSEWEGSPVAADWDHKYTNNGQCLMCHRSTVKASGRWVMPSLIIMHSCNRPAVCNWL